MREFIKEILYEDFGNNYEKIYNSSDLIQYLNKKTGAIDGDSKTRRSLGNIYAIYSLLIFYTNNSFYNNKNSYKKFEGFEYTELWNFCKKQYGGNKLQNHAFNNRLNGEFANKVAKNPSKEILVINGSKYLLHIDYLYIKNIDISKTLIKIIEKYISLLKEKDLQLSNDLKQLLKLKDSTAKKKIIEGLIEEKSEARIFEIISYAILKNHYKSEYIYIGRTMENIQKECLKLYKTGRTNANDGGIDFVMRPIGRFFQVTEVNRYDKYLLDMDKVMHFPITFVVKTARNKQSILNDMEDYIITKSGDMEILKKKYFNSIEEIITINELKKWLNDLNDTSIDELIKDIDIYYKLEFNI
ncbi:MAG: restriction endonuclease [Clostridia bacterium]|nr:restriction endonuclease [Clostridia bacterium]